MQLTTNPLTVQVEQPVEKPVVVIPAELLLAVTQEMHAPLDNVWPLTHCKAYVALVQVKAFAEQAVHVGDGLENLNPALQEVQEIPDASEQYAHPLLALDPHDSWVKER